MTMFKRTLAAAALAAAAVVPAIFTAAATAAEAAYPARPVRMIVPFAPGGPTDVIARVIAQKLSEIWPHQVVVDNRAGAGGNIGMGLAATAPPDGYTILVVSSSYVVNPTLYSKIPYDPYKSFIPVTNAAASPNVFTVHPSVPAKNLQELVALAKNNPKKYNAATPGNGTTPDLGVELLKLTTHVDVVRVPYSGAGPAVAAVIGNQVQIGSTALPPTTPHIQSGRLRAIAVTAAKRSPALPDVQTTGEAGFKGQEADTLQGVLLPAGTSKAIIAKVHGDIVKVLAMSDVKERVAALGFDVVASSPEQFAAQIKAEIDKWGKVIKAAGLKAD
jgi:tripartite-type tricarboxylate transporter receptor subunit TctC